MTTKAMPGVIVLGRDDVGVVAEDRDSQRFGGGGYLRYYLTECCGASAKGMENYVGCRGCYQEIDPRLGEVPDEILTFRPDLPPPDLYHFVPRPGWHLTEVYGDGIPYAEWKETRR